MQEEDYRYFEFRTTYSTQLLHDITDLIKKTEIELIVISPWFNLYGHLKEELTKAINRGVKVIVITRKPTSNWHKEAIKFLQTKKATILYDDVLHAKIIMADRWDVIFGSANLQGKALTENHELAIRSWNPYLNSSVSEYIEHLGETLGVDILGIAQDKFPPSIFKKIKDRIFKQKIEEEIQEVEDKENECPNCGGNLRIRRSQHGKFYGCSNYPACRYKKSISKKK